MGVEAATSAATWSAATVRAVATAVATGTASRVSTATSSTTLSTVTTVSTPASTVAAVTTTECTTASTAAATATLLGDGSVVLAVELYPLLLLDLLLLLGLAAGSCEEHLVLRVALESGAFWELLLRAFVGLANLGSVVAESLALLGQIGEVLLVRLRVVLWLRWRNILGCRRCSRTVGERGVTVVGVRGEASIVLGLCLCDDIASLLVVVLALASGRAPSMCSLLLVLFLAGVVPAIVTVGAVATVLSATSLTSATSTTSTASAATVTTVSTGLYTMLVG